jgi:transcriptional regulator with XRE-family HTH domain
MKHRRSKLNDVSADLVDYLVTRRGLTQTEIAEMIEVDKSFVSRVRKAEREFSPNQMGRIADRLGIPMGAMLIEARPITNPQSEEVKQIAALCKKLMAQADAALAAHRARRTTTDA